MVRVKDLKNQIGEPGPHPILLCPTCCETYSANSGDYFMADPAHVFKHCRRNMVLAFKRTVYEAA